MTHEEILNKALHHVEEATRNLGLTSGYESKVLDNADSEIKAATRKLKFVMRQIRREV